MSGGRLVVLDRLGRDVKRYPLAEGLATIGSDPACDIRVMLPVVSAHHATVVVHANQTVVRNVGDGDTLVNGRCVSVAALRHDDVITLGDRSLRWEYSDPTIRRVLAPEPALQVVRRAGRSLRRGSAAGGAAPRDRALQLALEMTHRSSMPGSTGGKQVAIVQPQRRDTNENSDTNPSRPNVQPNKRQRTLKNDLDTSANETEGDKSKRKTNRVSPKTMALQNTTKATLWIESRKTSPRKSLKVHTPSQVQAHVRRTLSAKKSTPLRMAVLKKAQSAQRIKVMKIEAPLKIDHTKQAAIMLMTGHTPKSKPLIPNTKKTPSYVLKKQSPIRKTPRNKNRQSYRRSKENGSGIGVTPMRASTFSNGNNTTRRSSKRSPGDRSVTILEITDSDTRNSTLRERNTSRRSERKTFQRSPLLPNPKKSALKDPKAKNYRKTESIKFDLSNLENQTQDSSDVLMVTDISKRKDDEENLSEDDLTLHYSDSSSHSPSPRKSIHSRGSKMLEKLGTSIPLSPSSQTLTPDLPRPRKSLRGSLIMQKALGKSDISDTRYSNRTTKSVSDETMDNTVASAFRTRTLSPRTSNRNMESYSIVDLVSIESNESTKSSSVYNSVRSTNSTAFGTPQNTTGRKTRSTINPTLLGSSTPYIGNAMRSTRSLSSPNKTKDSTRSAVSTRRSKSLSTPENTQKHISVNSTRISRASRSRSRINDSDLLLLDDDEPEDSSPKSSKRVSRVTKSQSSPTLGNITKTINVTNSPENDGTITPENRYSPENISTPVLSIQRLLNASQNSTSQNTNIKGRKSINYKRKTIGVISEPKRGTYDSKWKSFNFSARKTVLRLSKDSSEASDKTDEGAPKPDNEEVITPTSTVKLVPEDLKNKHSTAKKPQSKRTIIDDLNQSDIVKQLFNSPVKRKLSQSMTEFSRKQLFDDDEIILAKRPTRNTIALTGRTPDNSAFDQSAAYTPDRFVCPINTPSTSPNLSGIKRLFKNNSPENDLRNVKGVKRLLRTPRARKSVKNDLTNVAGVKDVFAKPPRNRLTDVRVKEVFAASPNNDLRRVSGVKSLFQSRTKRNSPKNDLSDVRGVKKLFKRRSPDNDLRNVSGVKRTLQIVTARNDLSDVRGVRNMFRQEKQKNDYNDVSGVEELFNESNQSHQDTESLFDKLIGKPKIKAVYSKTFSSKLPRKPTARKTKSLHNSLDFITTNVEDWLQLEFQKCLHKKTGSTSLNKSKNNVTRELKKIVTDTVEGSEPIQFSRTRNSSIMKSTQGERKKSASEIYSAHTLPIKKRSLVEASLEKSKHRLPIKKRALVHSTPVKGRINLTMNASELGRVSPIAAVDTTRAVDHVTSVRLTQLKEKTEVKHRGRIPKSKIGIEPSIKTEAIKISPRRTRAKAKSPIPRTLRNWKGMTDNSDTNAKKRNASLVITKKLPVLSPKVVPKVGRQQSVVNSKISPKRTRAARGKKDDKNEKILTPKRTTRSKVARSSLVVSKPSPKLKPQLVIKSLNKVTEVVNTTNKRTRNVKIANGNKVEYPEESQETKSKRKTRANAVEDEPKTVGRKTEIKKLIAETTEEPVQAKRGRKPNSQKSNTETHVKTRPKKIETQESVQSEPTKRTRTAKMDNNTVIPEEKRRKRKAVSNESSPKIQTTETRTRGKKKIIESTETETAYGRQKRSVAKDTKVETQSKKDGSSVKSTRAARGKVAEVTDMKKAGQKDLELKPTRGRKAAINTDIVPESSKRKRKPTVETSPPKDANKKQPAAKRARKAADTSNVTPVKTRGRNTRAKNSPSEVNTKPVGRSRRR